MGWNARFMDFCVFYRSGFLIHDSDANETEMQCKP